MAKHNSAGSKHDARVLSGTSDLQEQFVYSLWDQTARRCCRSLKAFLKGLCMECSIITLTIVDIFCITIELLIRAEVLQDPSDNTVNNDVTSPTANTTTQNNIDPGGGCRKCDFLTPIGAVYCFAHYISFIIALVFFIELLLRLLTGCTKMCKDVIQLIDAFTVFNLAAIEVMFTVFWEQALCFHLAIEIVTYIVALRLVRIPKACSVLKEEFVEKMDLEVHYLTKAKSRAEERSKELANTVQKQQREIDNLRKQFGSNSLYENDVIVHTRASDDPDSSTISNGHLPSDASSGQTEKSPKFVSTIKTNSNIVSMTAPAPSEPANEKRDSDISYAVIETKHRKVSSENKSIYKNVCHVKTPSLEVKRTNSEVGSRISFDSDPDTKVLIQRSKSVKGESIKKAIALLESTQSIVTTYPGGQSVSRTPSNKLNDLESTKMQDTDSGCVNGSFESDEEVIKRNLPVMAEFQGTKTYRSAEGIPLTDL